VAAFLVVRAGSSPAPNPLPTVVEPAVAKQQVVVPVAPPQPAKVTIKFQSDPIGAAVARQDTGEQLGVTPFEVEVLKSKDPLAIVFKKASFKEATRSIVPEKSAALEAKLEAVAPPPNRPAAKGVGKSPVKAGGAHHKGKGGKPMDEDGVLAPSF
jgi:hypothetical protein